MRTGKATGDQGVKNIDHNALCQTSLNLSAILEEG